jgi:hypothetical protein
MYSDSIHIEENFSKVGLSANLSIFSKVNLKNKNFEGI